MITKVLKTRWLAAILAALAWTFGWDATARAWAESANSKVGSTLNVVVMDPLAAPLSCPCVKGYAQRDYDKLGAFLEKSLKIPVKVVYAESLKRGEWPSWMMSRWD